MAITRMISITLILFLGLMGGTAGASETKITWLGHAAFQIVTPKGKVLMIDPWLKNPVASPPNKNNNKDKENEVQSAQGGGD